MCLYPKIIKNPKYRPNKKNGGNIPPVSDERVIYVPIGCNNCIECRKQKARAWQVRLLEDLKEHKNGKFITLTFSNESIQHLANETYCKDLEGYELDNAIATLGVRRFLERWRKEYRRSLRHWLVTELGHNGTENIHIHGIVWTDEPMNKVEHHWKYGFIWKGKMVNGKIINYVNEATVNYITKYVTKIDLINQSYKPIILTSPGIGKNYTEGQGDWTKNKYKAGETIETYRNRQGYKMNLPIYWRNKIYSEYEREKLWIEKLDKAERWVCGERVSVAGGDEDEYNRLVEWHRKRTKKLGYGSGEISWERQVYERERRIIIIKERMKKKTAQ